MFLTPWLFSILGQAAPEAAEAAADAAQVAASSGTGWIPWVGFLVLVFVLLGLDLGVLNRNVHEIKTKEALKWTCLWISLALLFSIFIYFSYDNHWWGLGLHEGAEETAGVAWMNYISGYLIEECLSLDNIAVIAMILASFRVPLKYQHRVLFWGILGALIMRGIMIACGAALVSTWSWVLWIFGALLIYLSIKSTFGGEEDEDPQDKWITKFMMKHFRYDPKIEGMHFFRKIDGKTFMTPLIVALVVVEVSDVIFAVDSIPAIFGITQDPYIVFTSNIFAILGLRSLYFVLASILEKFAGLKYSVGAILLFVAVKLLVPAGYYVYDLINGTIDPKTGQALVFDFNNMHPVTENFIEELPTWSNLAVIGGLILIGIVGSLIYDVKHPKEKEEKAEEKAVESDEKAEEKAEGSKEKAEGSEEKAEGSEEKAEGSEEKAEGSEEKAEGSEEKAAKA
ncbi:MAG: TerC/Alx family metal homeostasis membrane protein [Proteobacteria bacterium]|nr:TerC/Alx family metal homeostasis membrane protein [Pseudomonadota bacterium]